MTENRQLWLTQAITVLLHKKLHVHFTYSLVPPERLENINRNMDPINGPAKST